MHAYARYMLALLFVLSSIGGTLPATAEEGSYGTSYVSELTGATVDLGDSGAWDFTQTRVYPPSDLREYTAELITMRSDTGFVSIQFIDATLDPLYWDESSLEGFASSYSWGEILDRDNSSSSSHLLFRGAPFLDITRVTYSEFQTDESAATSVSLAISSNDDTFMEDLELLLAHVKLDGEPLFSDLDMPEIEAMLNGTSDIQPEPLEYEVTTVEDWEDFGLVSESEWHSPYSSSIITWTNELAFPFHNRIGVTYDQYSGMDRLVLTTPDFRGSVSISATDHVNTSNIDNLHLKLTNYGDGGDGAIGRSGSDSHSSFVYVRDPYYGNERVLIDHFILYEDGTVIWLTVEAQPEDIETVYQTAFAAISVDGQAVEPGWAPNEIDSLLQSQDTESGNDAETDTSHSSNDPVSTSESSTGGDTATAEVSGVTIDLGPSGEAVFLDKEFSTIDSSRYTLETIDLQYGTTIIIIDVMNGDVVVDDYMLQSESDIAATYDHTDWLGGEWSSDHSWDIYSGAYKLNYREHAYLELFYDPESDLYFGIGVYGSAADLPSDIAWIQSNITTDGRGILANADVAQIESVIDGGSRFETEPVPVPLATVEDWSDQGLVSETEWQSPFTSTTLTWDGTDVVFPFAQPDALSAEDGVTELELRTADLRGEIKLSTAETEYTPADWVANYTSEEYLESQEAAGQPVTILDSAISDETGSVILSYQTDFGDTVVVIMDVYVNADGVTILTEIAASPEDIADVYATFWDSVQSNGDFYPLTWEIEEIEALNFDVED